MTTTTQQNNLTTEKLYFTQKHLLSEYRQEIMKSLKSLERVAEKLGLPKPEYKFSDDYDHEFEATVELDYDDDGKRYEVAEVFIEKCFDLEINLKQTLKMAGGWSLVAANNHEVGEIYQIDESVEIPLRYKPNNSQCEHCGVRSTRVKSYIVKSESNEYKQVGVVCLKKFLGVNPKSYVSMFEAVSKFSITIQGLGNKIFVKGSGGSALAYNVETIFKITDLVVKKDGKFVKNEWKNKLVGYDYYGGEIFKKVRTNLGESTFDKVIEYIKFIENVRFNPNRFDWAIETINEYGYSNLKKALSNTDGYSISDLFSEEQLKSHRNGEEVISKHLRNAIYDYEQHLIYLDFIAPLSQDANEKFEAIKSWANKLEIDQYSSSDFENFKAGIKDCFNLKRILQTKANFVVAAYNMYEKSLVEVEKPKSEYVGVVGEKSTLKLKILGLKTGFGSYGTWQLWSLEDEIGNQFTKFGELSEKYIDGNINTIVNPSDFTDEERSKSVTIHASFDIKSHKQFGELKKTELGRISKPK